MVLNLDEYREVAPQPQQDIEWLEYYLEFLAYTLESKGVPHKPASVSTLKAFYRMDYQKKLLVFERILNYAQVFGINLSNSFFGDGKEKNFELQLLRTFCEQQKLELPSYFKFNYNFTANTCFEIIDPTGHCIYQSLNILNLTSASTLEHVMTPWKEFWNHTEPFDRCIESLLKRNMVPAEEYRTLKESGLKPICLAGCGRNRVPILTKWRGWDDLVKTEHPTDRYILVIRDMWSLKTGHSHSSICLLP